MYECIKTQTAAHIDPLARTYTHTHIYMSIHTPKSRRLQIQFVSICSSVSAFSVLISLACFCVVRLWLNNCLLSGASQHNKKSNGKKDNTQIRVNCNKISRIAKTTKNTKTINIYHNSKWAPNTLLTTHSPQNYKIKMFCRFVSRLWMTMKREIGKEREGERKREENH